MKRFTIQMKRFTIQNCEHSALLLWWSYNYRENVFYDCYRAWATAKVYQTRFCITAVGDSLSVTGECWIDSSLGRRLALFWRPEVMGHTYTD